MDLLADTGANRLRVVIVNTGGHTSVLVDLLGLGVGVLGVLRQFARNGLVLADNPAADSVVKTVEEVQEAG